MQLTREQHARLIMLANRFWRDAESPDEEAMESLFFYLTTHNLAKLEELCEGWNINIGPEED